MKKRVWGGLLILLMICLSCSEVKEYINIATDEHISKDYVDTLKKWTRDKTVYSQFETRVHIAATYKSAEFREAYRSEYSRIYLLADAGKTVRQGTRIDLASDFDEFVFYAYIPNKESNDFSKADSIWKVFLLDEKGKKRYPLEVRRIEKITPLVEEFFPYVKPYYGMFYSLKFSPLPPSGEPDRLTLVFTSVLGRVALEWPNLRGD